MPATVSLLVAMGAFIGGDRPDRPTRTWKASAVCWAGTLPYPLALAAMLYGVDCGGLPMLAQIALTLAILMPLGLMVYRIAYQPIADTDAGAADRLSGGASDLTGLGLANSSAPRACALFSEKQPDSRKVSP